MSDAAAVLLVSERLSAITALVSSAEYLARPALLAPEGLSSWDVTQLERRWLAGRVVRATVGRVLRYPAVLGLVALRFVASLLLVVGACHGRAALSLAALAVLGVSLLLILRSQYGHDGADQMMQLCFAAYAVAHLTGAAGAALWFVALQGCLAYATAGVAKLVSPAWRRGAALPGVFRTRIYGNARVYGLCRGRPRLSAAACRGVIAFECVFPLALVGPPAVTGGLLAGGVAFHAANAVAMRLNTFFWSFVATYPAVWYCAGVARRALGVGG